MKKIICTEITNRGIIMGMVGICIRPCKMLGFSLKPGFIFGHIIGEGFFAASGWKNIIVGDICERYIYYYNNSISEWEGYWEEENESIAADAGAWAEDLCRVLSYGDEGLYKLFVQIAQEFEKEGK